MNVLGLESSCDETAAAVVADGSLILSNEISSQVQVHARYGGVVPELASRHHLLNIVPVLEQALANAGLGLSSIDGIAVTNGPGLVGALLVAVQTAKAISYARRIPLVGVNHLDGHLSAIFLTNARGQDPKAPPFPHLALLVSGGHTALVLVEEPGRYRELGSTRDDAAGEAFDKVAKLLGLGYPGGPLIERVAATGTPLAIRLPRPLPRRDDLDFSFSGLKTWMRVWVQEHGIPRGQGLADLCASFQHAVVGSLVSKVRSAARLQHVSNVLLSGGVAANGYLRAELVRAGEEDGFEVFVPPPFLCTDNAAMIAAAGTRRLLAGEHAGVELNAEANLPLAGAS
ncbi:MAG: tRNA (adenosine(37)-N6)-threonylcarbamoyltransferase complex transferase subunit TsaD [Pseudomonadota bacterium]